MSNTSSRRSPPKIRVWTRAKNQSAIIAKPEPHYEVGFGRPPAATQFKLGQSGNPKGRPKGSKNLSTIVREVTEQKVTLRTANGSRKIPAIEALLRRLMDQAMKGDHRAAAHILTIYRANVAERPESQVTGQPRVAELSNTDEAILAQFAASILAEANPGEGGDA